MKQATITHSRAAGRVTQLAPRIAVVAAIAYAAGIATNVVAGSVLSAPRLSEAGTTVEAAAAAPSFDWVKFRAEERAPAAAPSFDWVKFRAEERATP
jgi:hypothetical protein